MSASMSLPLGNKTISLDWPKGFMALLMLLLTLLGAWALMPGSSPLTKLELRGQFDRLQAADVRIAAQEQLSAGFFSIDIDALHASVAALPWVAKLRIERRWPGRIVMHVGERIPVARWNAGAVLDSRGNTFEPRPHEVPAGLPRLGGRPGTEAEVARTWVHLSKALAGSALALEGISLNERGQWIAKSLGGVELRFGQAQPEERMNFLLGTGMTVLEGRWGEVAYIDLRYTNGFAVGWRADGDDQGAANE